MKLIECAPYIERLNKEIEQRWDLKPGLFAAGMLLNSQPEYNPWRKIDDTEGLVDGQDVFIYTDKIKGIGTYDNGIVRTIRFGEVVTAAYLGVTHYMVIPEPPKV